MRIVYIAGQNEKLQKEKEGAPAFLEKSKEVEDKFREDESFSCPVKEDGKSNSQSPDPEHGPEETTFDFSDAERAIKEFLGKSPSEKNSDSPVLSKKQKEENHIGEELTRTFSSGAARHENVDKGRFDLIPRNIMAKSLKAADEIEFALDNLIELCWEELSKNNLYKVIALSLYFSGIQSNPNRLIMPAIMRGMSSLAKRYQDGAKEHGENNWKLGIPEFSLRDSLLRHLAKAVEGEDIAEDHYAAIAWNAIALAHAKERE